MPLPICVVKNGMRVRRTKPPRSLVERGRLAAAPSMISGRLALRIISAARSIACRLRDRDLHRMRRNDLGLALLRRRCLRAVRGEPGRAALPSRRGTHRARWSESDDADTICRAILVTGRIELITSTIWNFACREDRMPFCPVRMIMGMAPRCA